MRPVVKHCVYKEILLRVPIYVETCLFFNDNNTEITRFARLLLGAQTLVFNAHGHMHAPLLSCCAGGCILTKIIWVNYMNLSCSPIPKSDNYWQLYLFPKAETQVTQENKLCPITIWANIGAYMQTCA